MAKKKPKKEEGSTLDGEDFIQDYIPQWAKDKVKEEEKKRGTHKQDNGSGRSESS